MNQISITVNPHSFSYDKKTNKLTVDLGLAGSEIMEFEPSVGIIGGYAFQKPIRVNMRTLLKDTLRKIWNDQDGLQVVKPQNSDSDGGCLKCGFKLDSDYLCGNPACGR